jgi:hypothetical protein
LPDDPRKIRGLSIDPSDSARPESISILLVSDEKIESSRERGPIVQVTGLGKKTA